MYTDRILEKNRIVKTLVSDIIVKKKPYKSIRLCRAHLIDKKDEYMNSVFVEPNGPLIVTHKTDNNKVQHLKNKK